MPLFLLVEKKGHVLKELEIGDSVSVQYEHRTDINQELLFAIGGNPALVKEGVIQSLDDSVTAPRTAVGYSEDGKTMYLVTVDGRQTTSRGMTLFELAGLMKDFGAFNALNLDGGGSSTMVARQPGENEAEVVNSPSDGFERAVPNGIGIFTTSGSGELVGVNIDPKTNSEEAQNVFPGLTRVFTASGYDDAFNQVNLGDLHWKVQPANVGKTNNDGVFHATKSGKAEIVVQKGDVKETFPIHVLGELSRIEASESRIGLAQDATKTFSVIGYDVNGYHAQIEPQDIMLSYDQDVISIEETNEGSFRVTPKVEEGKSLVSIKVNEKEAYLGVTVGLKTEIVSEMENLSDWRFSSARGSGKIEASEARNGNGLKVSYDFTLSTGTRTANVHPIEPIELPGQPQAISVWVKGSGKGEWMSFTTRGSDGRYHYLYGPNVTWTGWRKVEIPLPEGVSYPLELRTIGAIETNRQDQYTGELVYDDLAVKVSQTVEVPVVPQTKDPLVLQNSDIEKDRWKFAVLADSQFVRKAPNSQQVKIARESLRQIIKEDPEFLIVGGDLVDTAYPEDFQLAKQILEEEVGDKFPIYYVPGNHEIMGTGNLDNFKNEFKSNRYSFVHKGTQFILLDTSTGSLRTSDFKQLVEMKQTLEDAAENPAIKNVVVFGHHPTRDPLSTKNSQLSDRKEAELLEQWLTSFRENSKGKGAIYISGHAHTVHVERVDNVPYMVVGPAGKAPYGSANDGGFYAWTMLGIDETAIPDQGNGPENASNSATIDGTEWIRAKVNPILTDITMHANETMEVDQTIDITATGHQDGNLNFPLRYPASVKWSGSKNVLIIADEENRSKLNQNHIAYFNPSTGKLTAVKEGEVKIKVESNNVVQEKMISIQNN